MYKSKLQEMCVVKSWTYPKYSAVKDGPDHNPRFRASVFVNGMSFDSSTSCKTVKEAHNKAAEAALIHFISCSSTRLSHSPSPGYAISKDELNIAKTSETIFPAEVREVLAVPKKEPELQKQKEETENTASILAEISNLKDSKSVVKPCEEQIEAATLDINSLSLKQSLQDSGSNLAQGGPSKPKKHGKIDSSEVDGSSTQGKGILTSKESDAPAEASMGTKKQVDPEVSSFLLCNRVRVYSYVPDAANLPKGATVLQICDGRWVAMKLDFPNEKAN